MRKLYNFTLRISLISFFISSFCLSQIEEEFPTEEPPESVRRRRFSRVQQKAIISPLLRYTLKGGVNYAVVEDGPGRTFSNIGFDAIISAGWDLAYYPLFIEFESGYQQLFVQDDLIDPIHVIPLSLGFFYRTRSGPTSLLKIGILSSLGLFFEKDTNDKTLFALKSFIGPSISYDMGSIVIQPSFLIRNIFEDFNYFMFSTRIGFRF